jgi:hypothetical protein
MPSKMPNFSINDDRGNPLTVSKPLSTNIGGRQKGVPTQDDIDKYGDNFQNKDKATSLIGFTSPENFLFTNNPSEVGNSVITDASKRTDTNTRNTQNKQVQRDFEQARGSVEFKHVLDKNLIPIPEESIIGSAGKTKTTYPDLRQIYLGSFITTSNENEDPTMLGYDIEIDVINSPLFNGAVEDFIGTLPNYEEVTSRLDIIRDFKKQFFKFFNTNSNQAIPKVYYFREIKGLDRLVEANTSVDTKKSFVSYGDDFITLSLNEDVTQNMGYLSALYKSLSWSRINGKQVIPANLLRFNLNITITEIRNYKRFFSASNNPKELELYVDKISKYKYNLYECQFFFPKMPHGDSLDLSSPKIIEGYEIQFNYKFSTLKFYKFEYNNKSTSMSPRILDNRFVNMNQVGNEDSVLVSSGDTIKKAQSQQSLKPISGVTNSPQTATEKSKFRQSLERLGGDLKRAGINEINSRIITQAKLLNRTLDNIRNSIPLAGRMSPPTNVYEQDQLSLATDVQNAIRNFAGRSIRGFFKR